MKCPNCSHKNSTNAKFCEECGQKLKQVCYACKHENKGSAKYCEQCGNKLHEVREGTENKVNPVRRGYGNRLGVKAERRQLTVLFCDLVGSTALSEELDAEEYRQVILDYQRVAEKVVKRYGGHIAQYLGDGLLVYFGYPKALEDAPKASIRTALGILEAVENANKEWADLDKTQINIRMGIHTGLVVVDDFLALGDTVNIAARLEGLAPVNSVVISQQTKKLVEGWFELKSRGEKALKGIQKPIEIFQVLSESGARSRLEAIGLLRLSPILGRDNEIDILNQNWEQAKQGKGRFVLLSGEAGIGKSRLVEYTKQIIAAEVKARMVEFYCVSYFQNTPFYPIIDTLEKVILPVEKSDSSEVKTRKLEKILRQTDVDLSIGFPLMAGLLNLVAPEGYEEFTIPQKDRKKRTMNILMQIFANQATKQPLCLVFEDLHWADPSTLEWIELLLEHIQSHAIFVLCTTRPQFQPHWSDFPFVRLVLLNRLSVKMIEKLCFYQAKGKTLPKEVLKQIQSKTDGIPLFVEELSRMVIESGMLEEESKHYRLSGQLMTLSIPSTLQDSLMARLDKLDVVKETIQTAAVLGREFSFELLKAVSQKTDTDLKKDLIQLEQAGMVYQKGSNSSLSYIFKHVLIQDTAYESLLKSRRQELHRRVATVLEENFSPIIKQQPDLLAYHQSKTDLIESSIQNWKRASELAKNKFAQIEAIEHLKSALQLVPSLKSKTDRNQIEFDLLLSLSSLLLNRYGFSHPEIKEVNERLVKLSFDLNRQEEIFISQLALVQNELGRGNLQVLDEMEKLLTLASRKNNRFLMAASHNVIGMVHGVLGEYQTAKRHFELSLSYYQPELHEQLKSQTGGNLLTQLLGNYTTILQATGFVEDAEKKSEALHQLAKRLNTLVDLSIADALSCHFRAMQKDYPKVLELCDRGMARFGENVHNFFAFAMSISKYTSQACLNNDVKAAYLAWETMPNFRKGFNFMNARNYVPVGEAFKAIGKASDGLRLVEEALEIAQSIGEGYFLSELYRLKGDFLVMLKVSKPLVEAAYIKSLDIAKKQAAKWWELLTAISLARFWKSEGMINEAYDLLTEVYNWFQDGHELRDMQEAKDLITEMEVLLTKK